MSLKNTNSQGNMTVGYALAKRLKN